MYIDENDIRTPRDRGEEELRRLLDAAPAGVRVPCDGGDEDRSRFERNERMSCGCQKERACPLTQTGRGCSGYGTRSAYALTDFPLAMVYSPIQEWRNVYDEKKGFSRGTIFAELDKPFEGRHCR